jgi:hypothetical protein
MTHFTLSRSLSEVCVMYWGEFGIKSGEGLTKKFSSKTELRAQRYLADVEFFNIWKTVLSYMPTSKQCCATCLRPNSAVYMPTSKQCCATCLRPDTDNSVISQCLKTGSPFWWYAVIWSFQKLHSLSGVEPHCETPFSNASTINALHKWK